MSIDMGRRIVHWRSTQNILVMRGHFILGDGCGGMGWMVIIGHG